MLDVKRKRFYLDSFFAHVINKIDFNAIISFLNTGSFNPCAKQLQKVIINSETKNGGKVWVPNLICCRTPAQIYRNQGYSQTCDQIVSLLT
jgi:hypothetical protein